MNKSIILSVLLLGSTFVTLSAQDNWKAANSKLPTRCSAAVFSTNALKQYPRQNCWYKKTISHKADASKKTLKHLVRWIMKTRYS